MRAFRRNALRPFVALGVLILVAVVSSKVQAGCPAELRIVERTVSRARIPHETPTHEQKQRWFWQAWQVDYRLRLESETGVIVTPSEITATVEGWVSNSRVAGHCQPRWSAHALSGASLLTANADLVDSADEIQRCRERATLEVWVDEDSAAGPVSTIELNHDDPDALPYPRPILSLAPGAVVRVRLRLSHQHFIYGMYDPLLGRRRLELHLGPALVQDSLALCNEVRVAQADDTWSAPPEDRRDCRYFVSAPDSLHLEAHVPGNQTYRFPERPVRYGTRMRLSFWYLVAPGTEGECRARIAQNKETPTQFKILAEGAHEQCLSVVGRWTYVERIFCTEPEATDLVLDFRIAGADVGEVWIDDVVLVPTESVPVGP